jgi:hypothetical protein
LKSSTTASAELLAGKRNGGQAISCNQNSVSIAFEEDLVDFKDVLVVVNAEDGGHGTRPTPSEKYFSGRLIVWPSQQVVHPITNLETCT